MLLQPDSLLEKLRDNFQIPRSQREVRVKVRGRLSILFKRAGRDQGRPRLVLSGVSSQDRYDSGIRSDDLRAYCAHLRDVSKRVGESWEESERFADLTVVETGDRTPFFDTRRARDSVAHASPVQAHLELATGDKRDQEMANQIREFIRPLAPLRVGGARRARPDRYLATPGCFSPRERTEWAFGAPRESERGGLGEAREAGPCRPSAIFPQSEPGHAPPPLISCCSPRKVHHVWRRRRFPAGQSGVRSDATTVAATRFPGAPPARYTLV